MCDIRLHMRTTASNVHWTSRRCYSAAAQELDPRFPSNLAGFTAAGYTIPDSLATPELGRRRVLRHSTPAAGRAVCRGYVTCFSSSCVESCSSVGVVTSAKDITFACSHCASPLVVDAAAAGMTLPCQRCGKPTVVPAVASIGARATGQPTDKVADLRRQLKENESQRTEVTGYINQLSIQLHRWQLRLQTLEERRQQLESELHAEK
jgi:hypothetical protein